MFCGSCGQQIPDNSHFCQHCGQLVVSNTVAPASATNPIVDIQATPKKRSLVKSTLLLIVAAFVIYGVVRIWTVLSDFEAFLKKPDSQSQRLAPGPSDARTGASVPETPSTPAMQKTAQRILREKWAEETQKDLWRQGVEMTLQAHGTTLYVKYVLAGDAFAFQFHEGFLHDNAEALIGLGFRTVELSNGDNVWSWKLSN